MILKGLAENDARVLEVNANIPVTNLTTESEMTWIQILRRIFQKYRILSELAKNYAAFKKTHVIYVGYPGHVDVFLAYILAKLFNKKLVFNPLLIVYNGFVYEQGILKEGSLLAKTIKFTESMVYRICDIVFADTPFQKTHLEKDFSIPADKLRVLPIGADDAGYEYTPYTNKAKKINVVYYGLYSPIHGVEYIIECANLLKDDKNVTFTFIGQGNTYEKNHTRAVSLSLRNVVFHYNVPVETHLPIMQTADIFLGFLQKHPTVDRVVPNKVYQGLALGRVVLTADAPVTRSMFEHNKNMYLVKPADPIALRNAILDLKNDPERRARIAKNGYDLYRKNFDPKSVGKQLLDYIEEII